VRAEVINLGLATAGTATGPDIVMALSGYLASLGLELGSITCVGEQEREVEDAVGQAIKRSHLVIITGGRPQGQYPAYVSGREELAKKAVAKLLGLRLILQADLLASIKETYKARGVEMPAGLEKKALLPKGARAVVDPQGPPSGFYLAHGGRYVLYTSRLSRDVEAAIPPEIAAALSANIRAGVRKKGRVLRTYGLDESMVAETVKDVAGAETSIALYSSAKGVDISVSVRAETAEKAEELLADISLEAARRLGDYIYGAGTETMEEEVARLLIEKKLTIATAESCTGGLIAKRLTDVPGSSAYMERGVVTYSNLAKEELLGIPARTIEEHGAVSKETAEAMAEGIRWNAKTSIGLSVTGIAGPTGGTMTKPVGLVYIGMATKDGVAVKGYNFPGDRDAVRFASSQRALDIVRRYLIS